MGTEPTLILGAINAGVALVAGFGFFHFHPTPEQVGLINAFAAGVIAVITRSKVTPI